MHACRKISSNNFIQIVGVLAMLTVATGNSAASYAQQPRTGPAAPSAPPASTAPLEFEVATIKPDNSGKGSWRNTSDGFITSGTSALRLIMSAYSLSLPQQVIGLPAWASSDPFEVVAKMDGDTAAALAKLPPQQQWNERQKMMQALLAERFGLKVHHETRQMPIYVLTVVDPGKLKPSANGAEGQAVYSNAKITAHALSVDSLMLNMTNNVGRIIINQTGLKVTYDFTLEWAPDGADPSDPRPSIFTALDEQLGLKLKPSQGPVDAIVIDHVQRPSEN